MKLIQGDNKNQWWSPTDDQLHTYSKYLEECVGFGEVNEVTIACIRKGDGVWKADTVIKNIIEKVDGKLYIGQANGKKRRVLIEGETIFDHEGSPKR